MMIKIMVITLVLVTCVALKATLLNALNNKKHILMNQHTGMLDNFTILAEGGENGLLKIKESIVIKTLEPTLHNKFKRIIYI